MGYIFILMEPYSSNEDLNMLQSGNMVITHSVILGDGIKHL